MPELLPFEACDILLSRSRSLSDLPLTLNVRSLFWMGDEGMEVPRPRGDDGDEGPEVVIVTLGGFSETSLFAVHGASGARGVVGE